LLREGEHVKYESLGQITICWVGQDKQGRYNIEESRQRAQSIPRTRPNSRGAARDSHSGMYKMYIYNIAIHMKRKDWDIMCYLYNSFLVPDCLFFCMLKINHDSYEFVLEFSTVANMYCVLYLLVIEGCKKG
jgi:hypothetical protein